MFRRWRLAIVAACAFAPCVHARDVIRLTVDQAVQMSLARSPSSWVATARTAAAEARLRSARLFQNPSLQLAHWAGRDTGGLDEDVVLAQIFELASKRGPRIGQSRFELASVVAEGSAIAQDTTFAVKSAYYDAERATADLALAKDTLGIVSKFADAARKQNTAGDVARSNVLRAEIEQIRAEQDVNSVETDRDNRYATLRSLVGLPAGIPLDLTDLLVYHPISGSLPLLQTRAEGRPDVRAAMASVSAASSGVRVARTDSLPDLFLEGRHADVTTAEGGNSLRFGVTFPLFDWGRNRAAISEARAVLAEQQAKLAEALRVAHLEVQTAYNTMSQARKMVESFGGGRLDRSKELLRMAQLGYSNGASSYLEVLDAQRVYQSEQADYQRALAAYNTAVASLELAVGGPVR